MARTNFNEELILWFNQALDQTVGDKPEQLTDYLFDLEQAKKDLVFIVHERLYKQFGKARMTAKFFGISSRTVRNYSYNMLSEQNYEKLLLDIID